MHESSGSVLSGSVCRGCRFGRSDELMDQMLSRYFHSSNTKLLHTVGSSLKIPMNSCVFLNSNHCILVGCAGKVGKRRYSTVNFHNANELS